jgi:hypothetical protein
VVHRDVPRGQLGLPNDPVTAYVNNLLAAGAARVYDNSEGTDHAAARPHAGVQCLCGLGIKQLRTGASAVPPRCRHPKVGTARRARGGQVPARRGAGPSSPRARRTQSLTTDNLHKTFPSRSSLARGTTSDTSAAQPSSSHAPAPQRRRPGDEHATTTDTLTRVLTSTPTPTLTPRRSSGGRRRILPR